MLKQIEKDEFEDQILEAMAGAVSAGEDQAEAIIRMRGLDIDPVVAEFVRLGLTVYLNRDRRREKLEHKVLKLSPAEYKSIQEEYDRRREEATSSEKPAPAWYIRKKARREVERQERCNAAANKLARFGLAMQLFETWVLSSGVSLGDATREQLLTEAFNEQERASGHLKNVKFYKALAGELQPKQRVRDGIDLAKVHTFRERAYL